MTQQPTADELRYRKMQCRCGFWKKGYKCEVCGFENERPAVSKPSDEGKTKPIREELYRLMENALLHYDMTTVHHEDGEPYSLEDMLTLKGQSVERGREEITMIVDYIASSEFDDLLMKHLVTKP